MSKLSKLDKIRSWNLYLVTEQELSLGRKTIEVVQEAIAGGVEVVQLREKNLSVIERYHIGKELRKITWDNGVCFIVNDRVDLALALDADGVHLGQKDLPLLEARKIIGQDKIIGISVSNVWEAKLAKENGADYLGVGSIYPTTSKKVEDYRSSIGPKGISLIRTECNLPLVAIGGLNIDNCLPIVRAGADSIAVITALTKASNIREEASKFRKVILKIKEEIIEK